MDQLLRNSKSDQDQSLLFPSSWGVRKPEKSGNIGVAPGCTAPWKSMFGTFHCAVGSTLAERQALFGLHPTDSDQDGEGTWAHQRGNE